MQYKTEAAVLFAVAVLTWACVCVESAPWRDREEISRQACGDQLANILALVCTGRGYNMPFKPSRRTRRQIVDECCHRSCSPSMLELYCSPDLSETTPNTPIRKRSETDMESSEVHVRTGGDATSAQHNPSLESQHSVDINPLNNELTRFPMKHKAVSQPDKGSSFYRRSHSPSLRHHRNLLRSMRHGRDQGQTHKMKWAKNLLSGSEEATKTFQIGTVKPYFAGRAFASHRTNHILRAPSS